MAENQLMAKLEEAKTFLEVQLQGRQPRIGMILGSGLNPLAEEISDPIYVSFKDVPHMKMSTAYAHVGRFVCGYLGDVLVIAMQGRLHAYEGNSSEEVAFPVWLMHLLGVQSIITTNAAGGINESFHVGDFCIMTDQINFTGRNPVYDVDACALGERFFSMTDAFDPKLRQLAKDVAVREDVPIQEGVYLGLLGPSFETPAEIKAFRAWGADTVAMSVCEEVIAARQVGMRVLGVSLVSNPAAGIEGASPTGEEVMEAAKKAEADFSRLIRGVVAGI